MKKHYIPITKVDEEKRLVYLRAASETKDYAEESMDYDGSKPNFEKWSADAYKRSAGKSYGNIREMHSSIAAGKLNEPLIFDDVAKTVDIVVYVSDDNSWSKVKDGTLTGASIGGSYESIKFDPVLGVKRYVADLTEISLVDCPCNPDAVIEVIKSNGSVELMKGGIKSKVNTLQELIKNLEPNLSTELKKCFSFDEITDRVRNSIKGRIQDNTKQLKDQGGYSYGYDSYWNYGYFYVIACYDDSIVINGCFGDNGASYNIQIDYTIDNTGVVTLGSARIVSMKPVEVNDNDGNNEALELFENESYMEKGKSMVSNIMKKYIGGNDKMTEQEKQEHEELEKAMALVMKKFGTPEQLAEMEKAKKPKGGTSTDQISSTPSKTMEKEDDMAAAKKEKAMDKAVDPDGDGDDDSSKDKDEDKDMAGNPKTEGKKAAKKSLEAEEESSLTKSLGSIIEKSMNQMMKSNEMLLKRIESLEAQPATGGPVVTAQDKTLGGSPIQKSVGDPIDTQITMLKGIMEKSSDMQVREALSRQMATLEMSRAQLQPIVFNG